MSDFGGDKLSTLGAARRSVALSARAEGLMVALLAGKSVREAAVIAGVSRRTAYRMRGHEEFQRKYSAAKAELLDGAVAALHSSAAEFVSTLATIAKNPAAKEAARVQAAREGLAALYKGVELFDFESRLRALESATKEGEK